MKPVVKHSFAGIVFIACIVLACAVYGQENYAQWADSGKITINTTSSGYAVSGPVYDFPYLVRLSKSDSAFVHAQKNGGDIRFSNSKGRHLSYQIDLWDTLLAKAAIWVKVDTILGNNSTQYITMFWGKSGAADSSRGASVFDTANGFVGVWHLNENGNTTSGGYADATLGHRNGTGTGSTKVAAAIGFGQNFSGQEVISIPPLNLSTNTMTMSAWIRLPQMQNDWASPLFCRGGTAGANGMSIKSDGSFHYHWAGNFYDWSSGLVLPLSRPVFISLVVTPTSGTLYVGDTGMVFSSVNAVAHAAVMFDTALIIGLDPYEAARHFIGSIDEACVSKVSRSADWIRLCCLNQRYIPTGPVAIAYPQKNYTLNINEIVTLTPVLSDVPDSITIQPDLPYTMTFDPATGVINGWINVATPKTTYYLHTYNAKGSVEDSITITCIDPTGAGYTAAGKSNAPMLLGVNHVSQSTVSYSVPSASSLESVRFTLFSSKGSVVWSARLPGSMVHDGVQTLQMNAHLAAGVYFLEMKTYAATGAMPSPTFRQVIPVNMLP
jgi:hypothetical protein